MRLMILAPLAILACADESISGYADRGATYRLQSIDGEDFAARATIAFPAEGQVTGEAPCNSWSAEQNVPYPWFELGPVAVTRRACLQLAEETLFFKVLGQMTLAEVLGNTLILTNDEGREMLFLAE